jgi:hypothetical protein
MSSLSEAPSWIIATRLRRPGGFVEKTMMVVIGEDAEKMMSHRQILNRSV